MKRMNLKKLLFYLCAALATRVGFAGCYTLGPAVFAALYLEQINRKVLLLVTLWSTALFLPLADAVKYIAVILVSTIAMKMLEYFFDYCRSWWAAFASGLSLFAVGVAGSFLAARWEQNLYMIALEAVLLAGGIRLLSPVVHLIATRKPRKKKQPVRGGGERLKEYAMAYNRLSGIFGSRDAEPKMSTSQQVCRMQSEIAGKICLSCDMASVCLAQEPNPILGSLAEYLRGLSETREDYSEAAREVEEQCPYGQAMLEEAMRVFEKAQLNQAWYQRLLENREAIAQQLDSMAACLGDCAREYQETIPEHRILVHGIEYRLKERGVRAEDIRLYKNNKDRLTLSAYLSVPKGRAVAVRECAKDISKILHQPMAPVKDSRTFVGKEAGEVLFTEEPVFKVITGIRKKSRDGAEISGDNFTNLELADGTFVMGICDGMGYGREACRESEFVLELLENFLEAGFEYETAIRMMNSAMVLQGEDRQYSTVDLCCVDLFSGMAKFYKVGAAATFVLHDRQVSRIDGGSLPAGAMMQMEIDSQTKKLYHGDMVIQVSDGALDYLRVPDPEETFAMIIESTKIGNADRMAQDIMDRILLHTAGRAPDDITVMVSGVWER